MSIINRQDYGSSHTSIDSATSPYTGSRDSSKTGKRSPDPVGRVSSAGGTFSGGTKARRIRLYRNGDIYFNGVNMVLASEHFRTFDALLSEINMSVVADPAILTKGVRYIFTVGGQQVTSLDDLLDGHCYVCSSTTAFRRLDYVKNTAHSWTSQFKATIKGVGEMGPAEKGFNIRNVQPRMIWVFRAGPRPRTHVRTMLNIRTARTFEQVLSEVAEQVRETGPIKSIYSLNGHQLTSLKDFFADEFVFVAFGSVKYSLKELQLNDEERRNIKKSASRQDIKSVRHGLSSVNKRIKTPQLKTTITHKKVDDIKPVAVTDVVGRSNVNQSATSTVLAPSNLTVEPLPERLLAYYELGSILLRTPGTLIRKCEDRLHPNKSELIVKVIEKTCLTSDQIQQLAIEVDIMRSLHHGNITEVLFEDETSPSFYQVFEMNMGINLLDFVFGLSKYTEKNASKLVSQMFHGIQYLHSLNIVHRNINPNNILVEISPNGTWHLKLFNFALATRVSTQLQTPCGTPAYMSPEMIRGSGYDVKTDIWSAGVVGYVLLCGFNPFTGSDDEELFRQISIGQLVFPSLNWDNISNLAKDLIVYMLEEYPQVRSSASEVLDHPWISRDIAAELDIYHKVSENLYKLIESRPTPRKHASLELLATSSLNMSNHIYQNISISVTPTSDKSALPITSLETISKLLPLSTLSVSTVGAGVSMDNTPAPWLKTSNLDFPVIGHHGEGEFRPLPPTVNVGSSPQGIIANTLPSMPVISRPQNASRGS